MHDDRPSDDGNSPAALLHLFHHGGYSRHASFHAALGGDVVAHERETEAVAFPEFRRDTNPFVPTDDRVAALHVAELAADRPPVLDHDHRIHPLLLDFPPASSPPA